MSDKTVKVLLEIPPVVARNAKAAAAQNGVFLKQWWVEAATEKLSKEAADRAAIPVQCDNPQSSD